MKIVVLDGYTENPGDLSWAPLEEFGQVTIYDRTPAEEFATIVERVGDAEIVVTNKTPITRALLESCPSIKFIALLSTGYNVVDIVAAKEKGIPVSNIPTYGTDSVAQFAIALLLEVCHHIGHHSQEVYAGRWEHNIDWCFWDYPLIELAGKTIGLLGAGRIGHRTGEIAKALGMKVLSYSAHHQSGTNALGECVPLNRLLQESDVISLHCPLFPETQGIINKDSIAQMKDGVIIINTSRGPLIREQDLADALNSGKVAAAAMDVVSTEPIKGDNPLLKAKNCIITPHMAWGAKEARQRIMDMAADNIKNFMAGTPTNVVNK